MASQSNPADAPPSSATNAVLVASEPVPEGTHEVQGVDFEKFQGRDITVAELVDNMKYMGFQGSAVSEATRIINNMVAAPVPKIYRP
jgi:deoxyhypusine synthase